MPTNYTVQDGDCLSSIAADEGFDDWRTIYGDPANADFRIKRPDPNVICAGDVLVIPDKVPTVYQVPTGQTHTFSMKTQETHLRLRFEDAGDLKYDLQVGTVTKTDKLAAGDTLDVVIPANAASGTIQTWPASYDTAEDAGDDAITWILQLGGLDPADTVKGMQARLKNLGYDPGQVDGVLGPRTKEAIKEFQGDNPPLAVDGICGPKTNAALVDAYGM